MRRRRLEAQLVKHIDEAIAMEQNVLRMLDSVIHTIDDEEVGRRCGSTRSRPSGTSTGCRSGSSARARAVARPRGGRASSAR